MRKVAIPVLSCESRNLSPHFGRAEAFLIYDVGHQGVKELGCLENPRTSGLKAGEYIANLGIDAVLIPEGGGLGVKALQAFREAGASIYEVSSSEASEAIAKFIEGDVREFSGEGCKGSHSYSEG